MTDGENEGDDCDEVILLPSRGKQLIQYNNLKKTGYL